MSEERPENNKDNKDNNKEFEVEKGIQKTDEIIQELITEGDIEEKVLPHEKGFVPLIKKFSGRIDRKTIVIFSGFLGLILFLLSGIFLAFKLIFSPKKGEKTEKSIPAQMRKEDLLVKDDTQKELKTKEKFSLPSEKKRIKPKESKEYTLELKNFVVPYGDKGVLRVDVYLYFIDYSSLTQAKRVEILWREAIFNFLTSKQNLSPGILMNTKYLEEELLNYLKAKGWKIIPNNLEVEGVILRS